MGLMLLFFVSIVLILLGVITKSKSIGKVLVVIWVGVFLVGCLAVINYFVHVLFFDPTDLKKKDYYGTYIIDRNFYPGIQADWQYNHFRFEIKENDSIYFYITDESKIVTTYRGTISVIQYQSARLVLNMDQPTYPIVQTNPTTHRGHHRFYLVFFTTQFNNVFFRKGDWKPLEPGRQSATDSQM